MEDGTYVFDCPTCHGMILVAPHELNCCIFRHGVDRTTGEPIPPHTTKEDCDRMFFQNTIYGCGKPFQVIKQEDGTIRAVICDYL
jgi:hypothetical protein